MPTKQNLFEAIIEALYDMLEGIVGSHMVARAFPLLATLFLFILASNWFGLLPGVGQVAPQSTLAVNAPDASVKTTTK